MENINKYSKISGHGENLKRGFTGVNNAKNTVLWDEWETYQLKFSVNQPFDDQKIDMRLQANDELLHDRVLTQAEQPRAWLKHKYG